MTLMSAKVNNRTADGTNIVLTPSGHSNVNAIADSAEISTTRTFVLMSMNVQLQEHATILARTVTVALDASALTDLN